MTSRMPQMCFAEWNSYRTHGIFIGRSSVLSPTPLPFSQRKASSTSRGTNQTL